MGTHRSRDQRRTDLFLIRVWVDGTPEESTKAEWRGKVQRVVDGEAHQFNSWQELMDALLEMLSQAGSQA